MLLRRLCLLLAVCGLWACSDRAPPPEPAAIDGQRLVLYTSLPVERVNFLAAAFRSATGIAIDFKIDSEPELLDAVKRKVHIPSADALLISGVGSLAEAADSDVFRPLGELSSEAPESLRDPDGYWVGVGVRAEFIAYDSQAVTSDELAGYAELADAAWHGKLCLQRSAVERSRALIGVLIAQNGMREAEQIVRGWRANLATSVFDDQQEMLAAVDTGQCAVTIASSEQVAQFLSSTPATAIKVHTPTLQKGGTFRNVTGAGVSRHATNPELGERFVAWLSTVAGQRALHDLSGEFPLAAEVDAADVLGPWAAYQPSSVHASTAGFNVPDAALLAERARYR